MAGAIGRSEGTGRVGSAQQAQRFRPISATNQALLTSPRRANTKATTTRAKRARPVGTGPPFMFACAKLTSWGHIERPSDSVKYPATRSQTALIDDSIAFAAMPGEPFVEFQMRLRAKSPVPASFLIGYTNGYFACFPPSPPPRAADTGPIRPSIQPKWASVNGCLTPR